MRKTREARPRGYIYGAKLTFPVGRRLQAIPVHARLLRAVIQEPPVTPHWAKGLGGTERLVAEVIVGQEQFYLDASEDRFLWKITLGEGRPALGIRQLDIVREVADPSIARAYRVERASGGVDAYRVVTLR